MREKLAKQNPYERGIMYGNATFQFSTARPVQFRLAGGSEGNYQNPVFDPATGLILPYGASARVTFEVGDGQYGIDLRYMKARGHKPTCIFLDAGIMIDGNLNDFYHRKLQPVAHREMKISVQGFPYLLIEYTLPGSEL